MYRLRIVTAMLIFGSIGLFVRNIPLSSSETAFVRGALGTLFLVAAIFVMKKTISKEVLKKNAVWLILSGAAIGVNWVLLFEAYNYTSIATSTLTYYMAPVIVMIVSPVFLKEHLSISKIVRVFIAFCGMILVSGILETGINDISEIKGILFALGAACLYAGVIIMNKFIHDMDDIILTMIQLGVATVVLVPYILATWNPADVHIEGSEIIMLIIVGIVHTGIAYVLYFSTIQKMKAQEVAVLSYIDPASAIVLSAIFLHENVGVIEIIGAVMILGVTFRLPGQTPDGSE